MGAHSVQVRGTVRDPHNKEKVAHLTALADALPGKLTLYAADLLRPGTFDEAVRCCHVTLSGIQFDILSATATAS